MGTEPRIERMNARIRATDAAGGARWSLGDALDFECEAEIAKSRSKDDIRGEAGQIRAKLGCDALADIPRRRLFLEWIRWRREKSPALVGAEVDRTFRSARVLMWIVGAVLGGAAAGGYLHYLGREPVNVFWFLFWLVVFPLILSVLAVFLALAVQEHSGLGAVGRMIFSRLLRLRGQGRQGWEAWSGMIEKHGRRVLPLAKWPLLGLTQRFACAFGIGALLALWVRLVFTDIAFGWESTVGWSPEAWHAAARFVAAPWTWAFPSGVPSLGELRSSQFTHSGGMIALDPAATQAWWPFLIGCIVTYSVALRGLLIALLGWKGRVALNQFAACLEEHRHSDANALHSRLAEPLMVAGEQPPSGELPAARMHPAHARSAENWLVLLSEGVALSDAHVRAVIAESLGGAVAGMERVEIDCAAANAAVLDAVRVSHHPAAVLVPAATDPIEGIRKTLAEIASACAGRECAVLLLGAPERLPLWQRWADAVRLDIHLASWPPA